jgi:hypothetical protein
VWQQDINVASPGALAMDGAGNLWVARQSAGTIVEFSPSGATLNTIQMSAGSRPSALYFDASSGQLMVGDQGPDMNIKIYNVSGTPTLAGTFGIQGGYLDTTTGIKGQVGDKRFTRVVGIGKDAGGNLYVLNNPWGGGWDLGRNGGTDLHAYNSAGNLQWKLQSLNFEAVAAPDPVTDGAYFYSGTNIYTGTAGGTFVANTVDPFSYPSVSSSASVETGFLSRRDRTPASSIFSISTRRAVTSRFPMRRFQVPRSIRRARSRVDFVSIAEGMYGLVWIGRITSITTR